MTRRQDEALFKPCRKCGRWRSMNEFRKVMDLQGWRVIRCQRCADEMEAQKAFNERNPEMGGVYYC